MSKNAPSRASHARFKVGKYDVIAQPMLGSAQMLRYTVLLNGKRIGALASRPTESDCRFLEHPPSVPPVKPYQIYYRPGRPKKGTPARSGAEPASGQALDELSGASHLLPQEKTPE